MGKTKKKIWAKLSFADKSFVLFLFVMELFFIKSLSKLKKQIFHICERKKKISK